MQYTIGTPDGFVRTIATLGGELHEIKEYTNDRTQAKTFTQKQLTILRARSFFKYYNIAITITEV